MACAALEAAVGMLGNQLCARDNPIILNIFTLETRTCAQDYLKEESFAGVGEVFGSSWGRALLDEDERLRKLSQMFFFACKAAVVWGKQTYLTYASGMLPSRAKP